MAKLTGTNPDQVPTNADLGTMAYQDKDNVKVGEVTATKLEVASTVAEVKITDTDGPYQSVLTQSGTHLYIDNDSTGAIRMRTDGNQERVHIQSNGNVGIGNTSPAHKLDVAGEMIADSYNETYSALSGTTPTVNCEAGNAFSLTLSGNTTFTFSNPPASGTAYSFSIEIIQDASASGFTVTWPASVDWPAATAPTLTATASAKDVFVFSTRDGGSNWYGFTAGQALG